MLKQILIILKDWIHRINDAHYTSVPYWRPWRDF